MSGRVTHLVRLRPRLDIDRRTTLCGFYWADMVKATKVQSEATCKRCLKAIKA